MRRVLAWGGVVVVVALTAVLVGWRVHGGSWVRVETPSMGTRAPVGSLLWIAPVGADELRVGDLVTVRPAGSARTYSHLVAALDDDGTIRTRGAISGADPWRIAPEQVVGRAAAVWPGAGWVVLAAPVLGAGALLVWLAVRRVRDRELREPVAVLGAAVVLAAAIVVYRPLLGAQQLSFVPEGDHARATYVGTGLLPVRLATADGEWVDLGPGEVGAVTASRPDRVSDGQRFSVALGPALGWPGWAALVAACFVPAALTTYRRRAPRLGGVH